ncbi:hypothetical protein HY464_03090 [Candidatus Peregrinibacteria bacterium]|nr:hypothetical protein [Candidatus Peregrinibacteria bacterium]
MRFLRRTLIGFSLFISLTGCLPRGSKTQQHDPFDNPLYAKRYYDELLENLVSLSLHKDPMLQEKGKEKIIEHARRAAIAKGQEAGRKQQVGTKGAFIPMEEYVRGMALLSGNTLYLSPDFEATPGLSLRLFLTTVVDPRDMKFPDADAIDLGPLKNAYGAQEFAANLPLSPILYRTAVLFDTALERLVSFAQLSE